MEEILRWYMFGGVDEICDTQPINALNNPVIILINPKK